MKKEIRELNAPAIDLIADILDKHVDVILSEVSTRFKQIKADQSSEPTEPVNIYVETRECHECGHVGINDAHVSKAACNSCDWTGYTPNVDRCPGCDQAGTMTAACPTCGGRYGLLAEKNITWNSASAAQPAEPVKDGTPLGKALDGINSYFASKKADEPVKVDAKASVSNDAISVVGVPEFDALMDHIYENGTASEGVLPLANAFARALLASYGQHAQPAKSSLSVSYDDKYDCPPST